MGQQGSFTTWKIDPTRPQNLKIRALDTKSPPTTETTPQLPPHKQYSSAPSPLHSSPSRRTAPSPLSVGSVHTVRQQKPAIGWPTADACDVSSRPAYRPRPDFTNSLEAVCCWNEPVAWAAARGASLVAALNAFIILTEQ
jgi:hypothetical protein